MSDDRASESLAYYASHGPITDPALHAAAFAGLPADIRALTRAVQGLVFRGVPPLDDLVGRRGSPG